MAADDGLLFGLRVDDAGHSHPLTWADVDSAMAGPDFVWLHLDAEAERVRAWVRDKSGLDATAQQALLADETRPRAAEFGDALLLILRGANLTPGEEPDDLVSLRLFAGPKRLVTLRRRPVRTVEDVRAAIEAGRMPGQTGEVLVAICDQLTQYVGEVVESTEDRADALEHQMLTAESHELRARIGELRRTMIALRRYLAPQREALLRVGSERLSWLDERQAARLREITDRSIRYVEELDAAREHASVAEEELTGRLTERLEQRMYVLAIVTAVFLPLGFVTGLLGINVGGIPGSATPYAFAVVLGICSVIALVLLGILKRGGWF